MKNLIQWCYEIIWGLIYEIWSILTWPARFTYKIIKQCCSYVCLACSRVYGWASIFRVPWITFDKLFKILMITLLSGILMLGYSALDYLVHKDAYMFSYLHDHVFKITHIHKGGWGTGFFVEAPSGKIYTLTNRHVCDFGTHSMFISPSSSDRKIEVRVIELSNDADLCLLEAPAYVKHGLKVADKWYTGDQVWMLGYPRDIGLILTKGNTGVIRSSSRAVDKRFCEANLENDRYQFTPVLGPRQSVCRMKFNLLNTTALTSPGGSGSPIVNTYLEVISVNWGYLREYKTGLGVPLEDLKAFLAPY